MLAGDGGGERYVLADRQAQDIGGTGQGKAVYFGLVGDFIFLLEHEFLELSGIQDFARLAAAEESQAAEDSANGASVDDKLGLDEIDTSDKQS